MNRRSFLGAMVAAPIAAPAMVSAAPALTQAYVWMPNVRVTGCLTADGALHYGRVYHTTDGATLRSIDLVHPTFAEPARFIATGSSDGSLTDGAGI